MKGRKWRKVGKIRKRCLRVGYPHGITGKIVPRLRPIGPLKIIDERNRNFLDLVGYLEIRYGNGSLFLTFLALLRERRIPKILELRTMINRNLQPTYVAPMVVVRLLRSMEHTVIITTRYRRNRGIGKRICILQLRLETLLVRRHVLIRNFLVFCLARPWKKDTLIIRTLRFLLVTFGTLPLRESSTTWILIGLVLGWVDVILWDLVLPLC